RIRDGGVTGILEVEPGTGSRIVNAVAGGAAITLVGSGTDTANSKRVGAVLEVAAVNVVHLAILPAHPAGHIDDAGLAVQIELDGVLFLVNGVLPRPIRFEQRVVRIRQHIGVAVIVRIRSGRQSGVAAVIPQPRVAVIAVSAIVATVVATGSGRLY